MTDITGYFIVAR